MHSTRDKLLLAAIDLIAEKGYHGVSTREIASFAGLSEKTLFRHFGSKQNLLESAFDRFHYGPEMEHLFSRSITWDLEEDLRLISRTYHDNMNRNRKMIQIGLKEAAHMPGFHDRVHKHPRQLRAFLTEYFRNMSEQGKIIQTDPSLQANMFMILNYGAFTQDIENNTDFPTTLETFIEENVKLFTRALTP